VNSSAGTSSGVKKPTSVKKTGLERKAEKAAVAKEAQEAKEEEAAEAARERQALAKAQAGRSVDPRSRSPPHNSFLSLSLSLSCHTTHTTTAERRAEKQCRRRGASSGQKTKRGIEGEDPAAAFF